MYVLHRNCSKVTIRLKIANISNYNILWVGLPYKQTKNKLKQGYSIQEVKTRLEKLQVGFDFPLCNQVLNGLFTCELVLEIGKLKLTCVYR